MATKAATAWGEATVLEEVTLPQTAGEKRFTSVVQLLEAENGDRLVRFAYTTDGAARRGPVTLRLCDVERLHRALAARPELAQALALTPTGCERGGARAGKR